MSDWGWIERNGAAGELPVAVTGHGEARLLDVDFVPSDLVAETTVEFFEVRTDEVPTPGDVCILRVGVADAVRRDGLTVWVTVLGVDVVRHGDRETTETDELMQHLQGARKRRSEQREATTCENCREMTGDTRLTAEHRYGRELHRCANDDCGRLLSTAEYERWRAVRY